MSTGYSWEGIRQVCAMLLGAWYLSASEVAVSLLGALYKCSTFYLLYSCVSVQSFGVVCHVVKRRYV